MAPEQSEQLAEEIRQQDEEFGRRLDELREIRLRRRRPRCCVIGGIWHNGVQSQLAGGGGASSSAAP
eukprot:14094760-Heterocapsa_arctica.AAC.1